jgi:hypothetical protein
MNISMNFLTNRWHYACKRSAGFRRHLQHKLHGIARFVLENKNKIYRTRRMGFKKFA